MGIRVVPESERLRRLQLLTDVALAHLDHDELLAALVARTRELLGADTCAILLLDEHERELVARAALGIEEEVERGMRIRVGRAFAGRVAAERRPVVFEDADYAEEPNQLLREKGIKSLLGVPLLVETRAIGVLQVGTLVQRTFDSDDVELLQLAADRAAIAIEHARRYESERRARIRLEHVQAITDTALAHLELDELLEVIMPRIREILVADTCALLLLDKQRQELVARAAVGIEEEVERGVRIPIGRGFAGRVAADRQPVVLEDVDHADVLNPLLREKGIKSLLGVPLLVGGNITGVLHVGSLTPRRFTPDETELLQLVADRVSLAIERARLHEELRLLDELKLNFIANASHELRTPAASVYGALKTLAELGDALEPEQRSELLQMAYEQSERFRRLLEQLLDLSRLDARAVAVHTEPLGLRQVVTEIAGEVVPPTTLVQLDIPADFTVFADPLVLDRVLSNLLANAARYGAPPIVIAVAQGNGDLRIVVEDAGPGVPDELRTRLFERFASADGTGGSGLGLAIARAYARAHGGDLIYAPGPRGARFELIVPKG